MIAGKMIMTKRPQISEEMKKAHVWNLMNPWSPEIEVLEKKIKTGERSLFVIKTMVVLLVVVMVFFCLLL